jgi:hypothetical protein
MPATSVPRCGRAALAAVGLALAAPAVCSAAPAPGAPGPPTNLDAGRQGGASAPLWAPAAGRSRFSRGELTEVYYPRPDAPSLRDLKLRIGATVATRELTASPGVAPVAALGRCGQCRNACERGSAVSR